MSNLRLHLSQPQSAGQPTRPAPIGRLLVNRGIISAADLIHALGLQRHVDAPLGEILISEGLAQREDVLIALSEQHQAQLVDLSRDPPVSKLTSRLPVNLCLKYRAVPWLEMGGMVLVATSRPDTFDALRRALGDKIPAILPVLAEEHQITEQITRLSGTELAYRAANRVPAALSCRARSGAARGLWAGLALGLLGLAMVLSPLWTLTVATLWAFVTLMMTFTLKACALIAHVTRPEDRAKDELAAPPPYRLPRVSVLVPLLKENEIAGALVSRLSRLTYPKSLLEVVLVLEEDDEVTKMTLACTNLPPWMSVIEVPQGDQLTTKPRALNYALNFCQGSIIGVWDAEDAPEIDQIEQVVSRFQKAPQNVACLQGVLDYYNPKANWLSRCFAIEYAAWWRVLLPGVARLGLVIPLGGTTLFFRRGILEKLNGWDAHNVTEDADLGVRLARHGYVTELIPTVTYEEANCRYWPWVRQRSRWLKGFLITWCVHMRDPGRLRRDLGWMRFLGLQTMLLATFSQFACAPILWSFWLTLAGFSHPVAVTLGAKYMWAMVAVFVLAETLNLGLSILAVSGKEHRHLLWWVFTTPFYFTLGALAAGKALYEFVISPYFWDKTEHGVTAGPEMDQVNPLVPSAPLPASDGS